MFRKDRDVLFSLAERRDADRHDVQPVVKVLAKRAVLHRRGKVAVRGRDQPDVNMHGLHSPHALEGAVLKHPQDLGLHGQRHVTDLIEEDRAAGG
jgi:hypothetical protein